MNDGTLSARGGELTTLLIFGAYVLRQSLGGWCLRYLGACAAPFGCRRRGAGMLRDLATHLLDLVLQRALGPLALTQLKLELGSACLRSMHRLQHARRRRLRVAQVCLLLPAVGAGAKGTCARAQQLEPAKLPIGERTCSSCLADEHMSSFVCARSCKPAALGLHV